jgi:Zn-dependent peptidase ImmA (M78 family)
LILHIIFKYGIYKLRPTRGLYHRPTCWVHDERLTLNAELSNYNPKTIHTFFMTQLSCIGEVGNICTVKHLEEKAGLSAQWCSDLDLIVVESSLLGNNRYETVMHELFHVFFRDGDDTRLRLIYNPKRDPIERRADTSAINMLSWYRANKSYYSDFKLTFEKTKTKITFNQFVGITN